VTTQRQAIPAVEGWFAVEGEPRLLGVRCSDCATIVFPPRSGFCPNPSCAGTTLEPTPLGRTGRIWSYTTNHYPPPEPYVAPDPFEPYTVAAVELADEQLVVLGQVADGVDTADLAVGQEVEVVVETLFSTADTDHLVWRWRPTGGGR
jgi:hypothetical protein